MPTYLYACEKHGEFEEFHSMSIKLEFCPLCKEEGNLESPVKRLISGNSKGVVVLTGHELMAKTKEDIQKMKREVYSSEKSYANVVGEKKYNDLQTRIDKNK